MLFHTVFYWTTLCDSVLLKFAGSRTETVTLAKKSYFFNSNCCFCLFVAQTKSSLLSNVSEQRLHLVGFTVTIKTKDLLLKITVHKLKSVGKSDKYLDE